MGQNITRMHPRLRLRRTATDQKGKKWVVTLSTKGLAIRPYRTKLDMTATIPWAALYMAVSSHGEPSERERRLQKGPVE